MLNDLALRIASVSALVIVAACQGSPRLGVAALTVSTSELDWTLGAGDAATSQVVVVANTGDVPVVVNAGLATFDARFALADSTGAFLLRPGEDRALGVQFTPTHAAPGLALLQLTGDDGARHDVRLRAEVDPRADCRLIPSLPGWDDQPSPIPLEVISLDLGAPLQGPFSWSLVAVPDPRGPRLFADETPRPLGRRQLEDVIIGGARGHLNLVDQGGLFTVRVRDDDGRGCESTFFADTNLPGTYPHRAIVLTWQGEADLDLHVSRVIDGRACFTGAHVDDAIRCADDDVLLDCSSRSCLDGDWNGEIYSGFDDAFMQPARRPTGQGAELIYFPGAGSLGEARIAVEAIDAAGPVEYRLRVFHGRLAFFERVGVVFPGEVRQVTTTRF